MVVAARSDDEPLTGSCAIEYRGCFPLLQPEHQKRKHYAAQLHVAIMPIYFTLRPDEYFRVRFPTPFRINIYGMSIGLKKNSQMITFDQW